MSAKGFRFGKEGVDLTQGRLFHCLSRTLDRGRGGSCLFQPKETAAGFWRDRVWVCRLVTQRYCGVEQPAGTTGLYTQVTESSTEGKNTRLQALAVEPEAWKAQKAAKNMRTSKRMKKRTTYKRKAGQAPLQNQGAGCGAAALRRAGVTNPRCPQRPSPKPPS